MRRALLLPCALVLAAGCGDDGGPVTDPDAATVDAAIDAAPDAAIDAPAGPFALTSTAFTEGMTIPAVHTCNGPNTSPPLAWGPGPAGTMSYAVVLTDQTNMLVHWVIYDIPANRFELPADVDKTYAPADVLGAHQTRAYDNQVIGYLGPCPPNLHTYQFAIYALDVPTLPGATMTTTRPQAVAAIGAHDLAMATLTGRYMQP